MMSWRYQPVWRDYQDMRTVTLCEVYFDNDGNLDAWTEPTIAPSGDTVEELSSDIAHMARDAALWKPVAYDDLRVGMTFERAEEK